MRLFIGIPLAPAVREALNEQISPWRVLFPRVRWVKSSLWHLTLHFLGSVPVEDARWFCQCLEESPLTDKIRGATLSFTETGHFRHGRRGVLWTGIAPDPGLLDLHRLLSTLLREADLPCDERPFSPHITVGRVPTTRYREMERLFREYFSGRKLFLPSQPATPVVLYESQLTKQGPIYTPLFRREI
ncbi:MAG: RNA 2',3'-cyclic phosphodiesterase [Candidatus Hydrogenedentota bacterium]|nr:MAG: RNA 2',3'-cyclic phosphodiesterase [Candidatus Hydrogenedentota bacterium]